ncbi:hypothetical protein SYNTR_1841 [Candidatus Syntrophocurvum alkaliphilum]|uniref:Four helix bundle protein n=1 Tax=Candidatus Syntrophocurvum alkaliphilum TaxID=2293317 RepID=A0A6I6DCQ2_9FIRM|nr:four helix bundle protein [Candidatus Syntrophocurvum alkaliphilum]QGU00435.1 hypothetical protein SYNTR_1841 [Candidatus Syntrophocurvum alkaliphilum]
MNIKRNIIKDKSYYFALQVIKTCRYLAKKENEYVISRQLMRSGTSIGANIEEALAAGSRKDFIHKMTLASKEARESSYWIRLLKDSGLIDEEEGNKLLEEANELVRLLTSIVKTTSKTEQEK